MSDHLASVQEIYAAFGRGDIDVMLERLSEDIRWENWGDHFAQCEVLAFEVATCWPASVRLWPR
jgi:ketosteroid isomerase-like protein